MTRHHRPRRRWRAARLAAVAACGVIAWNVAAAAALATPAAAALDLGFSRFNATYHRPGMTTAPVVRGPLTLRLTSPENAVVIERNRLRLTPQGDGSHRAEWTAEFSGAGRVIADFELSGVPGRLEDQVLVPAQARTVVGRIRLSRSAVAVADEDSYDVTIVELPPTVEVAIESRLAGQLVGLCNGMAMLPLVALDCDGIEAALSFVTLPLPAPGETYLLLASRLTADERRVLDAYLTASAR